MKINIIGNLLGIDGYSNHTKGLVNALYKINPDIKLDIPLQQGWEQQVNDAELAMIKNIHGTPDVTIAIATPPFWRICLGDKTKHFIGFLVWEGDKIPKYWIEYLMDERVDQIWVPSLHTKDAICQTFRESASTEDYMSDYHKKIKIVPHGYDPEIFNRHQVKTPSFKEQLDDRISKDESSCLPNTTPFKFIVNKGWRGGMEDRGGVQYVLQAYANEFKKDENVELLLKLNPSYINAAIVSQKINELNLPKDGGKIKIACANVSQEDLAKLYNDSDVCVCATRAEAFDLGTAEAMACGLPIITTNYGGQIEHMDKTCAGFIDYELKEVKGDLLYEGIKQAVPNTQHLQKLLRAAFSTPNIAIEKGNNAKEFIKSFTWDKSAEKAIRFLKEL